MTEDVITAIKAREILDCRGLPTLEVDVHVGGALAGRADVPAGRSTGRNEAAELRDGGTRFGGFGVRQAVKNVEGEIAAALVGEGLDQAAIDQQLIELDGTVNKGRLGANALVGVSLSVARARAFVAGVPLYRHLNGDSRVLPVPQVNLINGGRHASNDLDFQEFIVMPVGATTFMQAMEIATETNLVLREILVSRYGKVAANVGDEGGFAPPIGDSQEALELLHEAAERAGHLPSIVFAVDCAATHLYDDDSKTYRVDGRTLDREGMIEVCETLVRDWGVVSLEDPLDEEDFDGFRELTQRVDAQIVGDDLFVTNPVRLSRGIEAGAADALLWKVNQIGTLTEALEAATLARVNGYAVVVSERSGETEDPFIADAVVALGAGQIKTGAPVRGERTAKYNALLRIEDELGQDATYAGSAYREPH